MELDLSYMYETFPLDTEETDRITNAHLARMCPERHEVKTRHCKKCTHWLITINSKDEDVVAFKQKIEEMIKVPWIAKFHVYCYEIGEKNSGLHIHMLALNNDNRKGRSIDQMFKKVSTVILNKACIDVAQIFDQKISKVLEYLEKANHPCQQLSNNRFRGIHNLRPIYRSSKLI